MANETVKIILNTEHLKNGENFIFNLFTLETRKIKWKKNPNCLYCSQDSNRRIILNSIELSLSNTLTLSDYQVIDLRTNMLINNEIQADKKYLLVCERGMTSLLYATQFRESGHANVWSLKGGIKFLPSYT
jgi:hypothetical protein